MAKHYVYSRLANSQVYTQWIKGVSDGTLAKGMEVHIKGGAGIASKHMITPSGVVTEVTQEEAEFLANDHHFKLHQSNGFVTIEKAKHEVEKVVGDMGGEADKSAPLTPSDYEGAEERGEAVPESLKANPKSKPGRKSNK